MPRVLWQLPGIFASLLVLLPLAYLLSTWLNFDAQIWTHLISTQLGELIRNSLILVIGVGMGVFLLGVSLAWLTALCEFPGRIWLDWALILPLAIPPYVLAFVVLGMFDFGGPVQSMLQSTLGWQRPLDVRNPFTVVWVMTAVLYPYVYLLTRNLLIMQGRSTLDAARLQGASPWQAFWQVGLPMARPGIVAGVALALMETLADFGTVSVFNFNTFTTAIYKSWIGMFSIATAAQLSTLLLGFVLLVLALEYLSRRKGRIEQPYYRPVERYQLNGWKALAATSWCLLILALTAILPLAQLLIWVLQGGGLTDRLVELVMHSFALAGMAAVVIVLISLLLAGGTRFNPSSRHWAGVANLGYAVPGSVLAVAVVSVAGPIDNLWIGLGDWLGRSHQPLIIGSLAGLVMAYTVRFIRPAYGPMHTGMQRIGPNLLEAAQLLGAGKLRILGRLYLPILSPAVMTATLLVFVDVLKEMPATLLLRPFGWDTLATRIFELTGENQWQWAAQPSLVLVGVSSIPVILLVLQSRRTTRF